MNRRNLFGYLGAAVVALAVPAALLAAPRHRFVMNYVPSENGFMYYMTVRHVNCNKQIQYGVDSGARDDDFHRRYLERQISRLEKLYGKATDASEETRHPWTYNYIHTGSFTK